MSDLTAIIAAHYPRAHIGLIERDQSEHIYHCQCGEWSGAAADHAAHVAAAIEEAATIPSVESAEQLNAVPRGAIVRSASGTIACRFDATRGVVFGDDRSFPWAKLALPVRVLWTPGGGE